jgi:protein-disulfide isomerase
MTTYVNRRYTSRRHIPRPPEEGPERLRHSPILWFTIAALSVLGLTGLIVWHVMRTPPAPTLATPAGVTDDGGARTGLLVGGNGPATVEVYTDFLCAQCRAVDSSTRSVLDTLAAQNKARVVLHPLDVLDTHSVPAGYSTRAANALACASDAGKLRTYEDALYAHQPADGSPGLSDDDLIDIAGPVGLNAPSFAACVRDEHYRDWVAVGDSAAQQRGVVTTPAIFVNGTRLSRLTPDAILSAVR